MSTIHLHQTTTLTPEQYVAGLTDFGFQWHLGTPTLRLVRSQPCRPYDDRLQLVGRRVGPHLHLYTASQRHDRH